MKKKFMLLFIVSTSITSITLHSAIAQSWNIAGNNNATAGSKLGTTNLIPLRLFTNDLERVRIDETGKIGIGTTTPVGILTVKTSGGTPAASWFSTTNGPVFTGFSELNTEFNLATASNSAGRRPVYNLRRSRGTLASPAAVVNNDFLASFVASGYDGSAFQNPATIDFYVDGVPTAGNVPGRISLVTGSNIGNRVERLKVGNTGNFDFNSGQITLTQSNGDVGIGVGNLTFSSGTQSIQFANPGSSPAAMMYMFTSGTVNSNRMVIAHSPAFPTWGLQYSDAGDQFDFLGSGTSRMSINLSNGNVGIGVASAVYKLEVCGTIRAKEVRVETGWCDYVFEKDYKLKSIDELEQFVNDNKHLPGIKPAAEVEKEGLKVGEMNKAMMEKIEESALYIIELNNKIKLLENRIDELTKKTN